jgi:hypothetical protein
MYVKAYFTGLYLLFHYVSVNFTDVCAFAKTLSPENPALPADVQTANKLKVQNSAFEHYMLFVPARILAYFNST